MPRRTAALGLLLPLLALASAWGGDDQMYDPVFREGKPGDVLVPGDPPLLRGSLDAFVELTQAAFDLSLPAPQEQALRDTLELGFGSATAEKRHAFLDVVKPLAALREKARQGDRDGAREGLQTFRLAIDRRLQDLPRATASRILGEALTRRNEVVWPGTPEIHGVAADAWLELVAFLASLGRNETLEPTPGQMDALRRDLDAALRGRPEEARRRVLRAHRAWLWTKGRWHGADEARRFAARWEAVRVCARAVPPGQERQVQPGPTLADYARAAGVVAEVQPGYDTLANLARNPEAVFEALEKGLEMPKELPDDILAYP